MRPVFGLLLLTVGSCTCALASAQTSCTNLCLQQVQCSGTETTSITGIVYAPNGIDPLPDVTVYIPNAPVAAFTPGVSCPLPGTPPSGSPLVGTFTAVDGSFTLQNVPVGNNIPIVIQTGRWRRQFTMNVTASCANNPAPPLPMPQNQSQGDIPKFAIATGDADQVECVLRKVGIQDTEFTDPSGTGRINFYSGTGGPGARIDAATPTEADLMGNSATLDSYDVLMLPCEGAAYVDDKTSAELANLVAFANAGGRVYSSHYSYAWMNTNPPFNSVVNWDPSQNDPTPDPGTASVVTDFSQGQTLSQWLELTGASTSTGNPAQISIQTLRHDFTTVNPPTQAWLTLDNAAFGNPTMQFVFDTPIGQANNQCGRVLFNEYHVENPTATATDENAIFPSECGPTNPMTPQEKLLEFSLFDLTGNGGAASLTPTSQDFGSQPLNFASPAQTFIWTNNSSFTTGVSYLNASGDFSIAGSNCSSVAAGASCQIEVVFTPTVLGARTGILTVGSVGTTLTSNLTGTGVPDLSTSTTALVFGNSDVGQSAPAQTFTLTNSADFAVPGPSIVLSGDYAASTNCGSTVPANSNCIVNVVFTPSATGARSGTMTVGPGIAPIGLTGNGVDFSLAAAPASGSVIAGYNTSFNLTATPIAGFDAPVSLSCTTNAPGSTCTMSSSAFASPSAVTTGVAITTTSQYSIVGYSALGGSGVFLLLSLGSGFLFRTKRKKTGAIVRTGLLAFFFAALGVSLTGCSGKLPTQNPNYTAPGNYTYTVTATDGFLSHSATYALTVTAK